MSASKYKVQQNPQCTVYFDEGIYTIFTILPVLPSIKFILWKFTFVINYQPYIRNKSNITVINSTIAQIPLQTKMSQHPPRLPVNNDSATSVDVLTSVKLVPSRAE